MIDGSPLETTTLFWLGPMPISETVVTTWGIMAALGVTCWAGTRRLEIHPGKRQAALELLVVTIERQVADITRREPGLFLPLVATLFIFLVAANLCLLLPGIEAPTAHLETTGALALTVFVSAHVYGIRSRGLASYLKHYLHPTPLMLPLNIVGEITRTFSLMVRLFGNIMSHGFVIGIILALAGLLVPIPIMALGIVIGLVQAYIFTVLATVFIGAAVGSIDGG